jgi:uncharacterized protein YjcR
MHGGAIGSGAPVGNQNALKHGTYSRENLELQERIRKFLYEGSKMLEEF